MICNEMRDDRLRMFGQLAGKAGLPGRLIDAAALRLARAMGFWGGPPPHPLRQVV